MTQEDIQLQIEIIRKVGAESRKTKESARQFLIDAGIIIKYKKRKTSPGKKKV